MLDLAAVQKLAIRPGRAGRYFERIVSGDHFFVQADTAWSLCHRLTREEIILYLDKRQSQGFNVVLTVLLPEHDTKPLDNVAYGPEGPKVVELGEEEKGSLWYPNRYGEYPLINDDPRQPNEAYFEHIDWVINQAAKRGILMWLVPSWSKFLNGGWAGGPIIFDEESAKSYGSFLGERYPFLPKILGGDSNPIWTDARQIWGRFAAGGRKPLDKPIPRSDDLPLSDSRALFHAMADGILSSEVEAWGDLGKPVLTYHPTAISLPGTPPALASAYFGDKSWLTLDACQSGHADWPNIVFEPPLIHWNCRAPHNAISQLWAHPTIRPVIDLEGHYEGMHNCLNIKEEKVWDGDDIRVGAWQSALSGACGVVYGANVVWQMYSPALAKRYSHVKPVCGLAPEASWVEALDFPGPTFLPILTNFFFGIPRDVLDHLKPAQGLLLCNKSPVGVCDADGRVDILVDSKEELSRLLIAHTGRGYAFTLNVARAFGSTTLHAEWLDPRTGKVIPVQQAETVKRGQFSPPSESRGTPQDDWVLVIRRRA